MDIEAKLAELHKKYPDEESRSMLQEWEKSLKKSSLYLDLRNHAAFKIICDSYYGELKKINKALQDDASLFKTEEGRLLGLELHHRKRYIKEFFRPFEQAKVDSASIQEKIDNSLKDI